MEILRAEPCILVNQADSVLCMRLVDGAVVDINRREAAVLIDLSAMSGHKCPKQLDTGVIGTQLEKLVTRFGFAKKLAVWLEGAREVGVKNDASRQERAFLEERSRDLQALKAKGLVFSEESLMNFSSTADHCETLPDTKIRQIAIPTCDRPDHLSMCINTFANNLAHHGRTDTWLIIVDDSRNGDSQKRNQAVVKCRSAESNVPIFYYSRALRKSMADLLARYSGVASDIISFAIAPDSLLPSDGATRNTIAAITTGNWVLQTDDDTRCAYAGSLNEGLSISLAPEPCECWVYSSHAENIEHHGLNPYIDALAGHEQLLGKSVASAIRASSDSTFVGSAATSLAVNLRSGMGRIGLTSTGCLGSPGLYASTYFDTAGSEGTLARLANDPDGYETAAEKREVCRMPTRLTLSRAPFFQAMSHAIDNTVVPPPYFPVGRNTDGAFVFLYMLSDPSLWIAHIPLAIEHCSDTARAYSVSRETAFSRARLTDLLLICMKSLFVPDIGLGLGLKSIGEQLVGISQMSGRAFRSYLQLQHFQDRASFLEMLQGRSQRYGRKFAGLRKNVQKITQNVEQSLRDPRRITPVDLELVMGAEAADTEFQRSIEMYGRLLCQWDSIIEASRQLALSGKLPCPGV